jgi:hypothetical protein
MGFGGGDYGGYGGGTEWFDSSTGEWNYTDANGTTSTYDPDSGQWIETVTVTGTAESEDYLGLTVGADGLAVSIYMDQSGDVIGAVGTGEGVNVSGGASNNLLNDLSGIQATLGVGHVSVDPDGSSITVSSGTSVGVSVDAQWAFYLGTVTASTGIEMAKGEAAAYSTPGLTAP